MRDTRSARCVMCDVPMRESCRFRDTGRSVLRCARCRHLQLAPQPDEAELEALYGREEYFSGDLAPLHDDLRAGYDPASPIVRLYARHLDRLAPFAGPPARLLEVGCARGVFADLARKRGYDVTVTDRNPHAVAYAARHFGIPGTAGRFEDVDVGGPFDAVASFDVIEHVRDPFAFLDKVAALLVTGGIAIIGTPNAASPLIRAAELAARVTGGRWQYPLWRAFGDGREHLHVFSRTGLARAARRAGLPPLAAYGYSIPSHNMRASPGAYALAARAAASIPYETVLIAEKK